MADRYMKELIPNTITLTNLLCGCIALVCLFNGMQHMVPFWIIIGLIADYTDGLTARLLKVNSELGKQLDSLADMVSFGIVPGAILFTLINRNVEAEGLLPLSLGFTGFLVSIFSAVRLANFNIDPRQSTTFIGLNTPASTTFVLGLLVIAESNLPEWKDWILQPYFLVVVSIILSYLLVSGIPMFSFKFKHLHWKGNEIRFAFMLTSIVLLVVLKLFAISLIIIVYILFSLLNNVISPRESYD